MTSPATYVLQCAMAKDYAPLCYQLRSGNPISADEREFIASFLEGKRQGTGRGASPRKAWQARRHYRLFYWLTRIEGDQPDHAYDTIAASHGISRRTAIGAVKMAIETGHAALVEQDETHLRYLIDVEFADAPAVREALEALYRARRLAVLAGEYQEP